MNTTTIAPATTSALTKFDPNAVALVKQQVGTDAGKFRAYDDVLTPAQRQQADEQAQRFNPASGPAAISGFGAGTMNEISDMTKPILQTVKMRDLGPGHDVIAQLLKELNSIDFDTPMKQPNWFQSVETKLTGGLLDPFRAWLAGLQTVEANLERGEAKLQSTSDLMLARATWFYTTGQKLQAKVPVLYTYAGAAEKVVDREQAKLDAMQAELATNKDPNYPNLVAAQRQMVDRMRAHVMDLHESAMFAVYMQPVMAQSEFAAEVVNDAVLKELQQVLPKIRLTLASLIAQRDIIDAATTADKVEQADIEMTKRLGQSLGQTNDAVESTFEARRRKVQAVRDLVTQITTQMQRAVEIDKNLGGMYDEVLSAYGEIGASVRNATNSAAA